MLLTRPPVGPESLSPLAAVTDAALSTGVPPLFVSLLLLPVGVLPNDGRWSRGSVSVLEGPPAVPAPPRLCCLTHGDGRLEASDPALHQTPWFCGRALTERLPPTEPRAGRRSGCVCVLSVCPPPPAAPEGTLGPRLRIPRTAEHLRAHGPGPQLPGPGERGHGRGSLGLAEAQGHAAAVWKDQGRGAGGARAARCKFSRVLLGKWLYLPSSAALRPGDMSQREAAPLAGAQGPRGRARAPDR